LLSVDDGRRLPTIPDPFSTKPDLVDKWSDLSIPFVKSTNTPTSRTEWSVAHHREMSEQARARAHIEHTPRYGQEPDYGEH